MFAENQFDEAMRLTYEFNEPYNLNTLRRFDRLDMRLLKRYLDAGRALREAFDGLYLCFSKLPVGLYGCEATLAVHLHPTEQVLFVVMDETADHEGLGFAPWAVLLPGEHKRAAGRWFDNAPDALRDYLMRVRAPMQRVVEDNILTQELIESLHMAFGEPTSAPVSRFLADGKLAYRGGLYNEAAFPALVGVLAGETRGAKEGAENKQIENAMEAGAWARGLYEKMMFTEPGIPASKGDKEGT